MAFLMGAATMAGDVFGFNQENFFFDQEQSIKRKFQAQKMRVAQYELYREDVRDLVNLTIHKMDNYLIVNTVQLGFCVTIFTDGRANPNQHGPAWLVTLSSMCNVGAFLYFLISIWLAMHASVAAHSFGVRLLTQFVRLPVPSDEELDKAQTLAGDFEGQGLGDILRIPVWRQQLKKLSAALANSTSEDAAPASETMAPSEPNDTLAQTPANDGPSPVAMLQHVRLYRQLQSNWQSYDAYARVSMAMGTNQLLHTLSYFVLHMWAVERTLVPWPAFCCTVLFTTCAWIIARLDLSLSPAIIAKATVLLLMPPVLTIMTLTYVYELKAVQWTSMHQILVPCIFGFHVLWIVYTVRIAKAGNFDEVALPTAFMSVLFTDVFGWLQEEQEKEGEEAVVDTTQQSNLPPYLQLKLAQDAHDDLQRDLALWEQSDVQELMEDDARTTSQLVRLREKLDRNAQSLQQLMDASQDSAHDDSALNDSANYEHSLRQEGTGPAVDEASTVWLRMTYHTDQHEIEYYHNPVTSDTVWTPPDGVRISDIQSLKTRVAVFTGQVKAISASSWARSLELNLPTSGSTVSLCAEAHSVIAEHTLEEVSPKQEPTSVDEPSQPPIQDVHEDHHTQQATASFWHTREVGNRPLQLQRMPGKLPWVTVLHGSLVLIVLWALGVCWSIAYVLNVDIKFSDGGSFAKIVARKSSTPVTWPGPFMDLVGMTCDEAEGFGALFATKYSLHSSIALSSGDPTAALAYSSLDANSVLDPCLAQAPVFQGNGFADITLGCRGNETACSVVLLGVDGFTALECPFREMESPSNNMTTLRLMGGPWHALASGDGDNIWAAGTDALVRLHRSSTDGTTFIPEFELPFGNAINVTQLHVVQGRWLLALQRNQKLHAWSLTGGTRRQWTLPAGDYLSMCTSGNALVLATLDRRRKHIFISEAQVPHLVFE